MCTSLGLRGSQRVAVRGIVDEARRGDWAVHN